MHDGGPTTACATWGWRAGETCHSGSARRRGPGHVNREGGGGKTSEAGIQRVTQHLSPQGCVRDACTAGSTITLKRRRWKCDIGVLIPRGRNASTITRGEVLFSMGTQRHQRRKTLETNHPTCMYQWGK